MARKRVAIFGVGLLGGSIGLGPRARGGYSIVGYGHRASTLEQAREIGAIDEFTQDAAKAVDDADLVILCTPVATFEQLLSQIAPALKEEAIVTDVGSTKRSVVRAGESKLKSSHAHFVGSHPMAGSEKRGIDFARTDLFDGARCIVTPTPATDQSALETVEELWKSLGMKIVRLSPDEHDRLICDISHLPHALAAALVTMQSDESLSLAGKGFLDTTRVASGDGALWRDILQDNRDNVIESIKRLRQKLDVLQELLDPSKRDELARWLDDGAKRRATLLAAKLNEME